MNRARAVRGVIKKESKTPVVQPEQLAPTAAPNPLPQVRDASTGFPINVIKTGHEGPILPDTGKKDLYIDREPEET